MSTYHHNQLRFTLILATTEREQMFVTLCVQVLVRDSVHVFAREQSSCFVSSVLVFFLFTTRTVYIISRLCRLSVCMSRFRTPWPRKFTLRIYAGRSSGDTGQVRVCVSCAASWPTLKLCSRPQYCVFKVVAAYSTGFLRVAYDSGCRFNHELSDAGFSRQRTVIRFEN